MPDKAALIGEIRHGAFYHFSPETREAVTVKASKEHLLLTFEKDWQVKQASDELLEWDGSGTKYEHHVRDRGYIVLDWE